jgi:hypothetical protein
MSDDLERELRVMLRDRATVVGDDLEVPADLETRVHRVRARRRLAVGGALAAVVLGAVGVAAMVIDRDRHGPSVQVQDPPTTQPRAYASPTRLVERTGAGVVRLLSPDGTIGRKVVHLPSPQMIEGMDLVGDTLWYLVMVPEDFGGSVPCATLQRVPLAGGEPQTVVDRTYAFAVSPDGSRLAYGAARGCGHDASDAQPRLIIRDLGTGVTHELADTRWSDHTDEKVGDPSVGDFSARPFPDPTIGWSPDGSQLVVGWQQDGHFSLAVVGATAKGTVSADISNWPGFAPAFLGNALWYIEQPGRGAPERLARRDLGSGEVVFQPSPFSTGVSQLEPGSGGSLYALTGAFQGKPGHLERWDHVHTSEVVIQDTQMLYLPSYIATG